MSQVDFYFDFSCPWSYLALVRLQDVAERNAADISLRPVQLDKILETENPALLQARLALNPAKAAWQQADLACWAEFWGLRLQLSPQWPEDRTLAACAAMAVVAAPIGVPFCLALFRAAFGGAQDINAPAVLQTVADAAGADSAAILAAREASTSQMALEQNTRELVRRGGFGTPSMFVDNQLFFGNDRIPLVEWTLGPIRDPQFVIPGQHSVW